MNYLKTPWTSQPQQTGLSDRYRFAFAYNATNPVEQRSNVMLSRTSGTALQINAQGVAVRGGANSSSDGIPLPATAAARLYNTAATIIAVIRADDWIASQAPIIYGVRDNTTTSVSFFVSSDGISATRRINLAIGGTSLTTADNVLPVGRPTVVAASFGPNGMRLFVDGVLVASNGTTSLPADNSITPWLLNRATGARAFNNQLNACYAIFGQLSDSEILSLSQNPWQIFKPLPRRIFVPVSAATGDGTGTGSLYAVTLSFPTGTASGTGAANGTGTGDFASSSLSTPSATATGSALATGALTTVTLTTITASATGSALATGSLDAIDLSAVSGSATGTTAGNAEGVGSVATIALSAPAASAVGSALATGSFAHVSLSAVSGTASAATNGQATADLQPISISAPLAIAIASSVATGGIQSIGLTAPTGSASGQAQTIARPGTDTSNSGWTPSTGSDLYAMLDEVTPNDADYISTASAGSVCRLGLGAVADPGTSSGQVVSYRASSSTGNGLKVELMQGGTVIATWNHASLPATDTTYQQSLSAAECDAITDYTALSVRLTSL